MWYILLHIMVLGINGTGTDGLNQYEVNTTSWNIKLWCWWSGLVVGQHYKVTLSVLVIVLRVSNIEGHIRTGTDL